MDLITIIVLIISVFINAFAIHTLGKALNTIMEQRDQIEELTAIVHDSNDAAMEAIEPHGSC